MPLINTVVAPTATTSGPPAQHTATSPTRAAGTPPINTFGEPTTMGPPTWGTLPVTLGQTWKSPTRAIGWAIHTPCSEESTPCRSERTVHARSAVAGGTVGASEGVVETRHQGDRNGHTKLNQVAPPSQTEPQALDRQVFSTISAFL